MTDYDIYPAVDENYNFPAEVRQAIADSQEIEDRINTEIAPRYIRRWQPNSAFLANEQAVLPDNRLGSAKADFTTGNTYDNTKWNIDSAISLVTGATANGENVLRTNLATSPNGEVGWVTSSGYSSTYDPTYIRPSDGGYGARQWSKSSTDTGKYFPYGRGIGQSNVTSSAGLPSTNTGLTPVTPGKSYGVGLWAVSTIDSPIGSITMRWYDINGNSIGTSGAVSKSGVAGIPQWYSHAAVAVANAAFLFVEFYLAQTVDGLSVVSNSQTWAWNVLIEQRTTAPVASDYFDGRYLQNGSITYRWTGVSGQSMSYQMQNDNLVRRSPTGNIQATSPINNMDVVNRGYLESYVLAAAVARGDLMISLGNPVYNAKGDEITDDSAAFTAAFADANSALFKTATILIPAKTYNLLSKVRIPSNVRIIAYGAVFQKTSTTNGYAFFYTGSDGNKGYGSGNSNILWEGGKFLGSFTNTTGRCAFALHHTDNFEVKSTVFEQMQAQGHVIDLAGCSAIRIRSCAFLGFNAAAGNYARDEAIQADVSDAGAVSATDVVGSYDGLLTKDVTVEDCKFLPLKVGSTTYPAPNPFGAHSIQEGKTFDRMRFLRNYVLDPRIDTTSDYKGIIHFIAATNSQFNDNIFEFSTPSNVATIVLYSTDYGQLASAGHEATDVYTPATFTPGVACDNVEVARNTFINYAATNAEAVVWVAPIAGKGNIKAGLVKVHGNKAKVGAGSSAAANFLKVAYAEHIVYDGNNELNGLFRGVDISYVDMVDVGVNRHIGARTDAYRFDNVAGLRLDKLVATGTTAGSSIYVSNSQRVRLSNSTLSNIAGSQAISLNNVSNFSVWEMDITVPSGTKGLSAYGGSTNGSIYNNVIGGGTTTHVDITSAGAAVTETNNRKL